MSPARIAPRSYASEAASGSGRKANARQASARSTLAGARSSWAAKARMAEKKSDDCECRRGPAETAAAPVAVLVHDLVARVGLDALLEAGQFVLQLRDELVDRLPVTVRLGRARL